MRLMRHRYQHTFTNCVQPRFVLDDAGKDSHSGSGKAKDLRVQEGEREPCHLLLKDLRMKECLTVAAAGKLVRLTQG